MARQTDPCETSFGTIQLGKGFIGTVAIQTHGCKLNQADSETLARRFAVAGYRVVEPSEPADIIVVNTCTVTHVADSKARQALRSAHRRNHPSALVVATGCYAQRSPQEVASLKGVGLVVGNTDKDRLVEMVLAAKGDQAVACSVGEDPPPLTGSANGSRTRAMVKIQEGCNQICAYCIVPKVRGRERSIPPEALTQQVRRLVEEGHKEIVLTGTQLGSYGFDLEGVNLKGLVQELLGETRVERLRISSLQPQEVTDDFLELWSDRRLCPHFHMPLQSGSDSVLKRMRRRYTAAEYARAVERVRARVADVAITADVIVGFPGEDESHFKESLSMAEEIEFASMHVFPYSVRLGTSAAHMTPKVDAKVKRRRMEEMLALARRQASSFRHKSIHTIRRVLWERSEVRGGTKVHLGLTDNYLKVFTDQDLLLVNQVTSARIVAEVGEGLLARVSGPR